MSRLIRYLTHPQVTIDPQTPVPDWSLSLEGRARVMALAESGVLIATEAIYTSDETKALETAGILAESCFARVNIRPAMGENDRSATGFLPEPAFEVHADAFFANPGQSVNGWESAESAQARIVAAFHAALAETPTGGMLFVGHGAVGTLLYCALAGLPIDRWYDQGAGGGGNFFTIDSDTLRPMHHWHPMEVLYAKDDAAQGA